ncbi:GNAT family N-acetyltransferase [Puia sp. P3]|uniref:GNAT family N-acetyltransferase n=1 Tax=Puia sp. P3 TaxID=3423952 RepID=UPI003D6750B8
MWRRAWPSCTRNMIREKTGSGFASAGMSWLVFLALMHRGEGSAQLRYFLLQPECRGLGLGKRMMEDFMCYLREKGYQHCYLWTTVEQKTAIALYRRYGFVLVEEKTSSTFGKELTEQKYELSL